MMEEKLIDVIIFSEKFQDEAVIYGVPKSDLEDGTFEAVLFPTYGKVKVVDKIEGDVKDDNL